MRLLRHCFLGLMLSLTVTGCSPEQRTLIRLTAIGFRDQATTAIESVRSVYQLSNPIRSGEDSRAILINRLLQANLDYRDVRRLNQIITGGSNQTTQKPNELDTAFNDLVNQYIEAAAVFNTVEQGGSFNSQAIAEAVKPARELTAKMLLLAKWIIQNPPTPLDSSRVIVSRRLRDLRSRYDNPKITEAERREIQALVSQQIDEWKRIDATERALLCDATNQLLRAAETGQKLSKLLDEYNRLSFNQVLSAVIGAFETTANLTGRDYSPVTLRLKSLDTAIQADPNLSSIINQLPPSPWQSFSREPLSTTDTLSCQS